MREEGTQESVCPGRSERRGSRERVGVLCLISLRGKGADWELINGFSRIERWGGVA